MNGFDDVEMIEKYYDAILQDYIWHLEEGLIDVPDDYVNKWLESRKNFEEDDYYERQRDAMLEDKAVEFKKVKL